MSFFISSPDQEWGQDVPLRYSLTENIVNQILHFYSHENTREESKLSVQRSV
jgi:hypothetical protein